MALQILAESFKLELQGTTTASSSKSPRLSLHSNPDILDEICEYLSYDCDADTEEIHLSRRTLLRLALTCKAFIEPALDRLWRSLDSLFPLLKILPAFGKSDGTYVRFFFLSSVRILTPTRYCEERSHQPTGRGSTGTRGEYASSRT